MKDNKARRQEEKIVVALKSGENAVTVAIIRGVLNKTELEKLLSEF